MGGLALPVLAVPTLIVGIVLLVKGIRGKSPSGFKERTLAISVGTIGSIPFIITAFLMVQGMTREHIGPPVEDEIVEPAQKEPVSDELTDKHEK